MRDAEKIGRPLAGPAPPGPNPARLDRGGAIAIFLGLLVFYTAFRQVDLTYDGAAFLLYFKSAAHPAHPEHPLFGRVLWLFTWLGSLVGVPAAESGKFQSALFTAGACGLYFLWLRREGVGSALAALFALLLGLNETALENATSVELYGASLFACVLVMLAWSKARDEAGPSCFSSSCVSLRLIHSADKHRAMPSKAPRFGTRLGLFAACLLLVGFHVGFSPLPLAVYVVLAAFESTRRARLAWLAQGAALAAALATWLAAEGLLGSSGAASRAALFAPLWAERTPWRCAADLFMDPLAGWSVYAGLILFPAAFGLGRFARARPRDARLALWAGALFWFLYALWTPDHGAFHTPLNPIFGLFAALGGRELTAAPRCALRWGALAAMGAWALIFMILPRNLPEVEISPAKIALAALWWAMAIGSWAWGRRREREATGTANVKGARASRPRGLPEPSRARLPRPFPYIATALALTGAAYASSLARFRAPDPALIVIHEFDRVAPPAARLIVAAPAFQARAQSRHEILSTYEIFKDDPSLAEGRVVVQRWLRESVEPGGAPVYIDSNAWAAREALWGAADQAHRVQPPLERFRAEPLAARGAMFIKLAPKP